MQYILVILSFHFLFLHEGWVQLWYLVVWSMSIIFIISSSIRSCSSLFVLPLFCGYASVPLCSPIFSILFSVSSHVCYFLLVLTFFFYLESSFSVLHWILNCFHLLLIPLTCVLFLTCLSSSVSVRVQSCLSFVKLSVKFLHPVFSLDLSPGFCYSLAFRFCTFLDFCFVLYSCVSQYELIFNVFTCLHLGLHSASPGHCFQFVFLIFQRPIEWGSGYTPVIFSVMILIMSHNFVTIQISLTKSCNIMNQNLIGDWNQEILHNIYNWAIW